MKKFISKFTHKVKGVILFYLTIPMMAIEMIEKVDNTGKAIIGKFVDYLYKEGAN